jgi:purine-binding chemotaxis protein CheW
MTDLKATNEDGQFVTLGIDREVFAVPVETVIEILDMRPVFRVLETLPTLEWRLSEPALA